MSSMPVGYFRTKDIEGHMELVRRQVEKSLADPELRNLAVRIVSRRYVEHNGALMVEGWGQLFHAPERPVCPPKHAACELGDLWEFIVKNCRYVYDPDGTDLFATAKITLTTGGGDCDDSVIAMCSLARVLGFAYTYGRVVSMDGKQWVHTYPVIGCPKDSPEVLIPFDSTVAGAVPGWEVANPAAVRDFRMY